MIDFLKKPWVIFAVAIPYFFCMNRYLGILIDGPLYVLQVMHRWFPERFVGDPPFMFGNQDSFTIFSPVYGFFIRHMPIDVAAMLVTFGIQLLFAVAFIMLVRAVARLNGFEHWTLPLSLIFFTLYCFGSGKAIIFFSMLVESYPVPRTLAVAFAILGLSFLFHKNKWITPIITMVGVMFHPLMAGWVLPVWLFYHFPKTRVPVVAVSALFPLTGYIGIEPFAPYSEGWYYRPLTYRPNAEYVFRFLMYIAFFLIYAKYYAKTIINRRFSFSLLSVVVIAFYWYVWTGINGFILLYQFQVWRIEWLCIVGSFLLVCITSYDVYIEYKKTHCLSTRNVAFLLFVLTLFSNIHAPEGMILALFLLIVPRKDVSRKMYLGLAVCFPLLGLMTSGYILMFHLGFPLPPFIRYSSIDDFYSHCVLALCLISVLLGVISLKKHEYTRALLALLYPFFPKFLLLPFVALIQPFLKRKYIVIAILLVFVDVFLNFSNRIGDIPLNFVERKQLLWGLLFFVAILGGLLLEKRGFGQFIVKTIVLIPILLAVPYAALEWDCRQQEQKKEEKNLDQFKWGMAFPQINDRSKIFYYVNGYLNSYSRLQFLEGNYVDSRSAIGEVFSKQHGFEATKRLNQLVYKDKERNHFTGIDMRHAVLSAFYGDSLSVPSILVNHFDYLCDEQEVLYLVSDFNQLPYAKQDSLKMNVLDKEIYLYACPSSNSQISKLDEN